jgi:hypothetical protein
MEVAPFQELARDRAMRAKGAVQLVTPPGRAVNPASARAKTRGGWGITDPPRQSTA